MTATRTAVAGVTETLGDGLLEAAAEVDAPEVRAALPQLARATAINKAMATWRALDTVSRYAKRHNAERR